MSRKPLVASGVAVLLAALLAGCGGGGDVAAFCKAADATSTPPGADTEDPEKIFDSAIEQIESVDPPSDIADDWNLIADAAVDMYEGMRDLDPESETFSEDSAAISEGLDEDKIKEASDNVDAFIAENCESDK